MRKYFISFLLLLAILANSGFSQELDTLYYFNPDDTPEPVTVLAIVTDLGVYFTPDTLWDEYSITNIQILVADTFPDIVETIYIRTDSLELPGTVIEEIDVLFNDTLSSHPKWYDIDVTENSTLANLTGQFWITGAALFCGMFDFSHDSLDHTYSYIVGEHPDAPGWIGPGESDLIIKAVVRRVPPSSAQNPEPNNLIDYSLSPNHPNPFNPTTSFTVNLTEQTVAELALFDVRGVRVRVLHTGQLSSGVNHFTIDGSGLPSGVYFYRLTTPKQTITRKCLLLK